MANTYTQFLYHIVFSTKDRLPVLRAERRNDVYRYIWGIIHERKGHLYRIGGVEDHVHVLTSVHPTVAVSDFVRDVKAGSSKWIRDGEVYGRFPGWQDGYGAFTLGWAGKDEVTEYIKRQVDHHAKESFMEEFRRFLDEGGVAYEEKYLK